MGDDRVGADDPEIGVLLSGEARLRQIFGGRRGAHGDRQRLVRAHARIGRADRRLHLGGHGRSCDEAAQGGRLLGFVVDVLHVDGGKHPLHLGGEPVGLDMPRIRLRRDREARRHAHAGADHARERGAFAADATVVGLRGGLEADDKAAALVHPLSSRRFS